MRAKQLIVSVLLVACAGLWANAQDERAVRDVASQIFNNLKAGNYSQLYDALPEAAQKKISREKFTNSLSRARDSYDLERMDIGAVRVKGDLAVVDTTIYGRVKKPLQGDGKIVAQQYLVRQNGRWRVATGDAATIKSTLKDNPDFAKKFTIRQPRVYLKNDKGQWVDLQALRSKGKKGKG